MLTDVKAYSSWRSAPTLLLSESGRAETDLIQIRNIGGLDPVNASIGTSPFGSVDGSSYSGASVLSRNIVLTLHPNPDWNTWTYESLRRLLYSYFMPKRPTRLVFYSDDMDPVEISGIVESVQVNMFSKDPELIVSIVCPDPYFTALEATVVTGESYGDGDPFVVIDYKGTIETGMNVKVTASLDSSPGDISIQIGYPRVSYFAVASTIDSTMYFEMNSIPMKKFVQNVNIGSGVITNLLSKIHSVEGSLWPTFQPGDNEFFLFTDIGVHNWELTYFERFGGL